MPLLFFGFLSVMAVWLFFALAWAVAVLFWPATLLIGGALLWRAQRRSALFGPVPVRTNDAPQRASGNRAFDEYRQETIARLDEEQGRFREFLDRLRGSRDHEEFRAFMDARRGRTVIEHGDIPAA
jgi:hypothetical protein